MSKCRSAVMCCFAPVRPIYKKNVDEIFPSQPQDGIVGNKLDILMYYVSTHPEKFDRIGDYLRQRIARHVYRGRKQHVFIGMQAMDKLLGIAGQHLNLFVESFLETIQELLESSDPDYQVKASLSFEQFSKITEDAPSYHLTYDFFIAKFSSMSHSLDVSLRISGLQGLMSVLRKTANEDLAQNIWEQQHMGKIVPSLLINLEERPDVNELKKEESDEIENAMDRITSPGRQADQILRNLVQLASNPDSSASISHLQIIIDQVLLHIDSHQMWDGERQERTFYIFQAIAYSMSADSTHILVQSILSHLNDATSITMKCHIVASLCKVIGIGVDDTTVGVAVIEITNCLLHNLCSNLTKSLSCDQLAFPANKMGESCDKGKLVLEYQMLLLTSIGQYTEKMPDFQKQETMKYILSKIPSVSNQPDLRVYDSQYSRDPDQHILMKAFFVVAEKSSGKLLSSDFNFNILSSLLRLLGSVQDHDVRYIALHSIQVLADASRNYDKFVGAGLSLNPSNIGISTGSTYRSYHQMFSKKYLSITYDAFSTMLSESWNTKEFLELMYRTIVIITLEMRSIEKTAGAFLNLIEDIQKAATERKSLTTEYRFGLHALSISLLAFLAYLLPDIVLIEEHLQNIINARSSKASHLLPPVQESYDLGLDPDALDNDLLIVPNQVKDALKDAGRETMEQNIFIERSISVKRDAFGKSKQSYHQSEPHISQESLDSSTETLLDQVFNEDAVDSGPTIKNDVSFEAFKRIASGSTQEERDARKCKADALRKKYLTASFTDLCIEAVENDKHDIEGLVQDIFTRLSFGDIPSEGHDNEEISIMNEPEPYERFFPELYIC